MTAKKPLALAAARYTILVKEASKRHRGIMCLTMLMI
jgi:hypothetical protein